MPLFKLPDMAPGQGHTSLPVAPRVTIGKLPDNVLLDIFQICVPHLDLSPGSYPRRPKTWYHLVHVCQRWRYVMFMSPLRLDLHLLCTSSTPVREKLDVWPPLPIKIWSTHAGDLGDNIIAALEHPDRICEVSLFKIRSSLGRLIAVMQEQFPALEHLAIGDETGETAPALSNTFLGGSAPRLRSLTLYHIPFPTLPQLLLSCNDLSRLSLRNIPHNGYISPAAMVRGISTLTRLTHLNIGFESSASRPDQRTRRPPLLTRTVLPALTAFKFCGVSEYLDDLVAQIDAPLLEDVDITLFNQLIFDIRHLPQFIGRTPRFISCKKAEMVFDDDNVVISLLPAMRTLLPSRLRMEIRCGGVDWQVSSMAQLCGQCSFLSSRIERLNIQGYTNLLESTLQIDMDNTQWLELLDPFIAAQTLRIPRVFRSSITSALEGLRGESASEVLPALADLYLERYQTSGSEQQDIEPFITARQRSSHPVSVHLFPFLRPPSISPQALSLTQTDIEGIGYSYAQAYDSLLSHDPNATSRARPDPDGPDSPNDPDGRATRQLNEIYDSRRENKKPSRSRGSKPIALAAPGVSFVPAISLDRSFIRLTGLLSPHGVPHATPTVQPSHLESSLIPSTGPGWWEQREVELGLGLTWAPSKIRMREWTTSRTGVRAGAAADNNDARARALMRERETEKRVREREGARRTRERLAEYELGYARERSGKNREVTGRFREVLGGEAFETFKKYVRRFDADLIPLHGSSGLLGRVERLLDKAPMRHVSTSEKRELLDHLVRLACENE